MKCNSALMSILFCGSLGGGFFPNAVLAGCATVTGQSITIPAYIIQRDAAVGSAIGSQLTTSEGTVFSNCSRLGGDVGNIYFGTEATNPYVMTLGNGVRVFSTGIPGIGYYIFGQSGGGYGFIGSGRQIAGQVNNAYFAANGAIPASQTAFFGVVFVKTGNITTGVSNNVPALTLGNFIYGIGSTDSSAVIASQKGALRSSAFSVTALACSLQTTAINVDLDAVDTRSLTRVGATARPKVFNLGLNCDPNANINVRIDGTQDPDTTTAGVLQINNTGTARGIGIQLLYNGSPFSLNTRTALKTSAGGAELLPFTAQYYQTRASVTPGNLSAAATLTITYQ
jgi:type 1 fimbria pilin